MTAQLSATEPFATPGALALPVAARWRSMASAAASTGASGPPLPDRAYYDVNLLLDRILRRLDGARRGSAGQLLSRLPIAPVGPLAFVPHVGESPWLRLGHRAHDALVTWGRRGRRAFALWPVDEQGRVRFNLAGPAGAREEPASVSAWFADQLRALVDADTGRPVVAEIASGEPLAAEGYLGDRPDLLVRWAQPTVGAVRSPALGTLEHTYRGSRTGDHRRHGLFFLARPGLVPGRLPDPVPVTDLAPMIAETLGVPPGDGALRVSRARCAGAPDPSELGGGRSPPPTVAGSRSCASCGFRLAPPATVPAPEPSSARTIR